MTIIIRSLILSCLVYFTACAGVPAFSTASGNSETAFFNTSPSGNGLVFIGAAGRRSNPKDTLQYALEDAAKRVSMFHRVSGEYAMENNLGSGAFDYSHNTFTSLFYDEAGSHQYIDTFQFDVDSDTMEIDNTFFIRVVYPSSLSGSVNYRPVYSGQDNKPDWVTNPDFKINGYETGIGFSNRFSSIADTYANSSKNAVFAIIRNINTVSRSSDMLYQETGSLFGYKTTNDNITYSYGTLNGFYILDTWVDPRAKTIWTLAIARKSE